ncbi:MAG: hypothetical protein WCW47_03245 [Candidatus Paceibacterota bacterium]|jgi:hypothetical protein
MIKKIIYFFDKLEDKTRGTLSHYPFLYAFIGGIGVVLFWRGVWHFNDFINDMLFDTTPFTVAGLLDGPLSLVVGSILLLITGIYVSVFVGNRLIISGLKGEKKIVEKTEEEIISEESEIQKLQKTLNKVEQKLENIESELEKK